MSDPQKDPRPGPLRATSRSLPIALLRARERVMEPIRGMLSEAGVTEQQWRVLRVLAEDGPTEHKALAARSCLFPSSLTRILDVLEAKDLIRRLREPKDRRRFTVAITDGGDALIARNTPASNAIFREIEQRYGAERLDQLLDLLEALAATELSPP